MTVSEDLVRVLYVGDGTAIPGASAADLGDGEARITVRTAGSAAEGLGSLADGDIDCVVSEYALGGRNGIEFLEAVRRERPDLPFVLCAGEGSEAIASEAIAAGVTDYVPSEAAGALATRVLDAVERSRSGGGGAEYERELRRTKHRYRAIFEDPNILAGLIDTDGTVLDINRTAMEYVDATLAEVTGEPFRETPWFDHAETAREEVKRWVDRAASGEYVEFEADRVQPNGDVYTVEGVFRPVTDDDGEVVSLLITSRDVTDEKGRERQLSALNRVTRELIGAGTRAAVGEIGVEAARDVLGLATSGIHLYDAERAGLVPVAITEEGRELVGDPPTFTEGDSIAWRVYERGEPLAKDRVDGDPEAYNRDTAVRSELYLPLDEYGILIAGSPAPAAFDDSDVLFGEMLANSLVAAFEQVERTEQLRERERELTRQNDRLEQFASVVSHDLRNPLNVAEGRLEMARAEHGSEHLEAVEKAHGRIEALIDDLLALARQGEAVTDPEPVALTGLLEGCWGNVRTDDAALVVGGDPTIRADRSRLKQLFENLFRNAVEHGGDGVTVTVGPLADGFYVEDDGPGIPDDERDTVFDAGYSTDPEGTGFGLSIVEEITEAHGWTVRAAEGSDGGARFEITGVGFPGES